MTEPDLEVPAAPGPLPEEFHAVVVVEGVRTLEDPSREFSPGALTWPDEPVPVMLQLDQTESHGGGRLAGAITRFERRGGEIHAWGYPDTGSEDGVELARLIAEGLPVGPSIQPDGITDADVEVVMPEGTDVDDELALPERVIFHAGRIREVTILPVRAMLEAYIEPAAAEAPPAGEEAETNDALAASLVGELAVNDEPGGREGYEPAVGDRVTWPVSEDPDASWEGEVVAVDVEAGTAEVQPDEGGDPVLVPIEDLTPAGPEPVDEGPPVVASATDAEQTVSERFAAFLDRHRLAAAAVPAEEPEDPQASEAPQVETSGMIAAVPADPGPFVLEGGEAPEQLHVTLAFLGQDVTGLAESERAALHEQVAALAAATPPIEGRTWATAHFNPTGDSPAAVYLVGDDSGQLAALQAASSDLAASAGLAGEEHSPWVPHLTAAYGRDPSELAAIDQPVPIAALRLALGDETTDYPLAGGETPLEDEEEPIMPDETDAMIASAAEDAPLAEWFADPALRKPTPLTVTADGRVFGHLATWGTCHTGFGGACVTPPKERDLGYYTTGEVLCAGGETVAVGHITLGTGHAGKFDTAAVAAAHYDNTGAAVADVAAGNDRFGIWLAGALRSGVSPEQVHVLRASALSGDWRRIGGKLRLVAALAVNVPGFPIPRTTAMVAAGVQTALVASGIVDQESEQRSYVADLIARDLGRDLEARQAALVASVHPPSE